jgi:hypothetical protein
MQIEVEINGMVLFSKYILILILFHKERCSPGLLQRVSVQYEAKPQEEELETFPPLTLVGEMRRKGF